MLGLHIYIDIRFSREFYASKTKAKLLQCVEEIIENAKWNTGKRLD